MKKRFNCILLIIVSVAMAMMLGGCKEKYQVQEIVENGTVSCFVVTVIGPANDLIVILLSPTGDSLKQNIEKTVMENMKNSATVRFAFCELGKGYPCSPENRGKNGFYKLLVQNSESKKVVLEKTVILIGGYDSVEIVSTTAQATAKAGL